MLSNRIQNLEPSPTLALDAAVKKLQREGVDIVNLGPGEPDFPTPSLIGEAGVEAIRSGFTHYTSTAGIPELREAIANKLQKENDLTYSSDEIVVGIGSKALLYNIFQVLCNPGDEVMVATPTWTTYIEQIKLAEGVPVEIPLLSPFKLTAKDLEEKITSKSKIILLNSPANPTGAVIDTEELKKIGELAVKHNLYIVSDEIYDQLLYSTSKYQSIATLSPEIKKRVIVVNGFSKSYAMTGWRIGYAAGPKEIVNALIALQGQTTSNTSSIAQKAAVTALTTGRDSVELMRDEFSRRRDFLINELNKINEISFTSPEGAFYFFVSIKNLLSEKYPTSAAWCAGLLEKERVAVVPGEAFHAPGYFRLSFAASMENLEKGIVGIKKFIDQNGQNDENG